MNQIRGEVDHCRARLIKYCKGQGVDLGCGWSKIRIDAIGVDLLCPDAELKMDARLLDQFPDEHFDYVFSSHLLEEIENTEATLREWLRVLKVGGHIVLYQADINSYYPLGDPLCNRAHKHHFSPESLWEIFKKIGGVKLIHSKIPPKPEWSFELVVEKTNEETFSKEIQTAKPESKLMFRFMVIGGPAENYIEKCLESITTQNYTNWTAQVILDPVGDNTYNKSLKYQSNKLRTKLNTERLYNVANFLEASRLLNPQNEDVMVMIDADDWLASNQVLSILKENYDSKPDLLVTHGSWKPYPKPNITNNFPYTEYEFKNNIRKFTWRGSHLRTCKYKIWKHLKEEDLKDQNGKFYSVTGDLALMFPLLEILYIYNQETPFSDDKMKLDIQRQTTDYIASRPSYPYMETF